jgi:hypothetical protein
MCMVTQMRTRLEPLHLESPTMQRSINGPFRLLRLFSFYLACFIFLPIVFSPCLTSWCSRKLGGSLEMDLLQQDYDDLEEDDSSQPASGAKKRKRANSVQKELFVKDSAQARLQRGLFIFEILFTSPKLL